MAALVQLVQEVESELARSYGFSIRTSASECLLLPSMVQQMQTHAGERGAVLVYQEAGQDEIELGIFWEPTLIAQLEANNPLLKLSLDNLDIFCVLIEEISHFHLIANRASCSEGVSLLELEWQGEIDKVLLASSFLMRQTGKPCLRQLTHLIFDRSQSFGDNTRLYDEALHYAAQHWYKLLNELKSLEAKQQWRLACEEFKRTYPMQWPAKLHALRPRF